MLVARGEHWSPRKWGGSSRKTEHKTIGGDEEGERHR